MLTWMKTSAMMRCLLMKAIWTCCVTTTVNALGKVVRKKEDETDREYLERFVSHVREFEFNSLDMASQLDWVRTAKDDERMKFGYLYSQLDKLPEFYEEGGTGYLSALSETLVSHLSLTRFNLIGFGAGKGG